MSKKKKLKKDGQLVIRIAKEERDRFIALCDEMDSSAAREIRLFIRDFVARHDPLADTAQGRTD
jgi:hypothetical protein